MRLVLSSTREVAHYWANQTQSEGRASSLSFRGDALISFRSQIARLVPGVKSVLFDQGYEGYSVRTSGHLSIARRALSHTDWPNRFTVANIHVDPITAATSDTLPHAANLRHYRNGYALTMTKAAKARSNKPHLETEARGIVITAQEYCKIFNVPNEMFNEFFAPEVLAAALAKKQADDAAIEARLRAREKQREADEALWQAEQAKIDGMTTEERIEAWRCGGVSDSALPRDYITRLRIISDEVRTSKGAAIPLEHARRAWPVLCRARKRGTCITREQGAGLHFGVYTSFSGFNVDGAGVLTVGCHNIAWEEIAGIAGALALRCED